MEKTIASGQIVKHTEIVEKYLGPSGRMIAESKGRYSHDNPRNVVVFDGNICTRNHGKIWFGDIDITEDFEKLQMIAERVDEPIYVLCKNDARFESEENLSLENAVVKFEGGRCEVVVDKENYVFEDDTLKVVEREYEEREDNTPDYLPEEKAIEYPEENYKALFVMDWRKVRGRGPKPPKDPKSPINQYFEILNAALLNVDPERRPDKDGNEAENPFSITDIFLSKQAQERLKENTKKWMCRHYGYKEDSYDVHKAMLWLPFNLPCEFYGAKIGPKWADPNITYLRIGE